MFILFATLDGKRFLISRFKVAYFNFFIKGISFGRTHKNYAATDDFDANSNDIEFSSILVISNKYIKIFDVVVIDIFQTKIAKWEIHREKKQPRRGTPLAHSKMTYKSFEICPPCMM